MSTVTVEPPAKRQNTGDGAVKIIGTHRCGS